MKILIAIPDGYQAIEDIYGDCMSANFYKEKIIWQRSPIVLRLSWQPETRIGGFLAHCLVGPIIADAIAEIRDFGGIGYLRENDYDLWGGCYNPRGKRMSMGMSTHAWGISADWCPALGPMGGPNQMPYFIVDAFKKRGFIWGGEWDYPDPMHFQAAKGY